MNGEHARTADINDPDPLYDAPLIAFVWSAWAATNWWIGARAGLWVLIAATALLGLAATRHHAVSVPRSFVVDFATILLFCAATIAAGVLGLSVVGG